MELASEVGLSHEALYQTLAALVQDGVIKRTHSSITSKGMLFMIQIILVAAALR